MNSINQHVSCKSFTGLSGYSLGMKNPTYALFIAQIFSGGNSKTQLRKVGVEISGPLDNKQLFLLIGGKTLKEIQKLNKVAIFQTILNKNAMLLIDDTSRQWRKSRSEISPTNWIGFLITTDIFEKQKMQKNYLDDPWGSLKKDLYFQYIWIVKFFLNFKLKEFE